MKIFKKIRYNYLKRNRYLDPYLQDLISNKTGFEPYEIKVIIASKEPKTKKEFNYFEFSYQGLNYTLKDEKLQIKNEYD